MNNANFYGLIEQRMPQDRSAACLRVPGAGDVSWRELHLGAGRMAALLAGLQLAPGSRLVAQVDKSPEALMLYLATLRSGLVYVPLNVAYQEAELRHFLDDSQPSVAVCAPGRLSLFDMLAPGAACFSLDEHGQGTLRQRRRLHRVNVIVVRPQVIGVAVQDGLEHRYDLLGPLFGLPVFLN